MNYEIYLFVIIFNKVMYGYVFLIQVIEDVFKNLLVIKIILYGVGDQEF